MLYHQFSLKILGIVILSFCTHRVTAMVKVPVTQYAPTIHQLGLKSQVPMIDAQQVSKAQVSPEVMQRVKTELMQSEQPIWNRSAGFSTSAGVFRPSRPALFRATVPRLMTRSEALQTLGISDGATPQEIKAAYKTAALKAHPDTGGSDVAMQKINEAYQIAQGKDEESDQTGASVQEERSPFAYPADYDTAFFKYKKDEYDPDYRWWKRYNAPLQPASLLHAIDDENVAAVQNFIRSGVDINKASFPPIMLAVKVGNPEIVKALLDAGADPNIEYNGETPLYYAASTSRSTPIEFRPYAKRGVRFKIIDYLLKAGANPNVGDPLVALCSHEAEETFDSVDALLKAGANPNQPNKFKRIPLLAAISNDWDGRTVKFLLQAGANVNIEAYDYHNKGNTALHHVVLSTLSGKAGLKSIVHSLIAAGVDINKKNKEGKTALDMANEWSDISGAKLVADTLRAAGARSELHPYKDAFERLKSWRPWTSMSYESYQALPKK
ncbi:MAG TPA: ankyrin repeat domain-containing protein [Candidatus Saccharimonadales bacterium]|nr:ankyrin repeat domain-containing protein [Candidatus Saccharimonadales bacterium]